MKLSSEVYAQNCDPDRDLNEVVQNLAAADLYVEGQDDIETLRGCLAVIPDIVLVAREVGSDKVIGNICVPFSPIPFLSRLAVAAALEDPKDVREVKRVLYNKSFDVIRARHPRMPHAEELFDWRHKRSAPDHGDYSAFGFEYRWDIFSVAFPLRDEKGNPTYIPSVE